MINISSDLLDILRYGIIREKYLKIEFYDSEMNFIDDLTDRIIQDDVGTISVDVERSIRRSFNFSLDNYDGRFTWGENNLIWLDKRCRVYIGFKLPSGEIEYIPQGVFILSEFSTTNTEDRRTIITGQDKSYLYVDKRGKFKYQTTVSEGVNVADAIRAIANDVGEVLYNFDTITATVPYDITFQANDNRWDAIAKLAKFGQCQIYYDVYGYLRLKKVDFYDFDNTAPTWTYEKGDGFFNGTIKELDQSQLANHIIVLGGSSGTATNKFEIIVDETNPTWTGNTYSIQKIGDILYFHNGGSPDGLLTTEDECKWRAKFELMNRLGFFERVSLPIKANYIHEGNDLINIIDEDNEIDGKYKIQSFEIPIQDEEMVIQCYRYNQVIEDWDFI